VDPLDESLIRPLPANSTANMDRWAPYVRALILQLEAAGLLSWTYDAGAAEARMAWGGATVVTLIRPDAATLAEQARFVRAYVDQRPDRGVEVMSQMGELADFFAHALGLTSYRNPHLYELIALVQTIAGNVAMLPKHMLAVLRPDEVDTRILPMIDIPGHGSYPSAHASQVHAIATVLDTLIVETAGTFPDPEGRRLLTRMMAHRIAANRTVAGVHYPIDSWAGAMIGRQVGLMILALCRGGGLGAALTCDANARAGEDFLYSDVAPILFPDPEPAPAGATIAASPSFAWLWDRSATELAGPAA
jgi:hypothetical protein